MWKGRRCSENWIEEVIDEIPRGREKQRKESLQSQPVSEAVPRKRKMRQN
jgi:hypothetical protein